MADNQNQPTTHISEFSGRIRTEATDPPNPQEGDMFFDTTLNILKRYNGTKWLGAPFND